MFLVLSGLALAMGMSGRAILFALELKSMRRLLSSCYAYVALLIKLLFLFD